MAVTIARPAGYVLTYREASSTPRKKVLGTYCPLRYQAEQLLKDRAASGEAFRNEQVTEIRAVVRVDQSGDVLSAETEFIV